MGAYYRPHTELADSFQQFQESLAKVCSESKSDNIWFRGDFNLLNIEWNIPAVKSYATRRTISGELLEPNKKSGLTQTVKETTYNQEGADNILDLFFTSNPTLVQSTSTIPGIGDHEAVHHSRH